MSCSDRNHLIDVIHSEETLSSPNSDMRSHDTVTEPTSVGQQEANQEEGGQTYKLSKQRWLVLFAIMLYGLVGSGTGGFRAILDIMLDLLELPLDKYIYIGQLFMYLPAITTLPTAWLIDKYGLKIVMYLAILSMLIRSVFRALMFYPDFTNWHQLKITYWVLSGLAASQCISIFFCVPLKISENWFAESERSIAWTMMMSSYSIGETLASFFYPRFVHKVDDVKPLAYLNFISGIVVSVVILLCITRSKPKHPPSARTIKSSSKNSPWFMSIKKLLSQRDIILHSLHEAILESMIMGSSAVIQDILISSNHSKIFVGNLLAATSLLSLVIQVPLAAFVHRITDITLTCKIAAAGRALIYIIQLYTILYPTDDWIVFAVSFLYVVCAAWAMPNNNNMTAHLISGTVSEATIIGVSTPFFVVLMSVGQVAFVKLIRKNSVGKSDYSQSINMASIVIALNSLVYIIFFKGKSAEDSSINNIDERTVTNGGSNQTLCDGHDNGAFQRQEVGC